jgi:hypothetical protein
MPDSSRPSIVPFSSCASQSIHPVMFRFLMLALFVAMTSAFMAPVMPSKIQMSKIQMGEGGKGFGGGEATRDPEPTEYDPNDPKGKQQAIHKAESFAEYLAKRKSA